MASFYQCCQELGINYNTVQARIRRGMSVEEAITKPVAHKINNFDGVKEYVEKYGKCSIATVKARMKNKYMTLEEAAAVPAYHLVSILYKGVPLKRYCDEHGLVYRRVLQRYRSGWSLEDAVNKPCKSLQKVLQNNTKWSKPSHKNERS